MKTALTIYWLVAALITGLAVYGWVANVLAIIDSDFTDVTGILVIRCIGVVLAPLGAVMGYA